MLRSVRSLLPILAIVALALPANAQFIVKQGAAYTLTLPDLIATSDHIAGLTGQTGTAYLVRVTGTSGAITKAASTNNISEIDSVNSPGQYTLTLTATETGALGWIKGYYKSATSDPVSFTVRVVAFDPDDAAALGLSRIDAAVSSRSTYAGTDTSGTITLLARIPGTVQPQTGDAFARLGAPTLASVSADINSRLASSAYTAPANPTDYARNNVAPTWLPGTFPLSTNDELALTSLLNSYTTVGGSVFKSTALANAPTGSGGGSYPTNFSLLSIDGSGKVALQSAEHTAIQNDAGTGVMAAVVDGGFTMKQCQSLSSAVLTGNYTVTRNTGAKTITVVYYRPANPGNTSTVLATLVTNYSDTGLTIPTTRTVTFSNLP